MKIPNAGSTPTNPYRQEVNLNQEVQTIQNNVAYYGDRVDAALSVAKDVYNLKSNEAEIVSAYSNAKNLSQEISQFPHNKVNTNDIVTLVNNPSAPAAGQYNYQINPEQQSQLSQALAAMSKNPFKNIGMISSQNNNGAMNGLGVQVGYKQFFGESKRWGLGITAFLITTMPISNPAFLIRLLMYGLMAVGAIYCLTFSTIRPLKRITSSLWGYLVVSNWQGRHGLILNS